MKPHRPMPPDLIKYAVAIIGSIVLFAAAKMGLPQSTQTTLGVIWASVIVGHSIERGAKLRGGSGHAANIIPPETVPTSLPAAKKKKTK